MQVAVIFLPGEFAGQHPQVQPLTTQKPSNGTGIGTFTSDMTGLLSGTLYHVRAYATNEAGTAYGNEVTFTTDDGCISDSNNRCNICN